MACQDGVVVDCYDCYHAAQGKPKQFTPEEEQKFLAADNLFRGAVISALHPKYEKKLHILHIRQRVMGCS